MSEISQAVAELRARAAAAPGDANALAALGTALRRAGRADEAIDCFRRALALSPEIAELWFNLGNAQAAKDDTAAALESFRRAIELRPDMGTAHFNVGNTLRDLGRLDEAEAAYRRALALMPLHGVLTMNLGNLLRRMGRLDEAIACHQRAIALEPQRHDTHYNLANALNAKGEREEAIRLYRKVLSLRPEFAEAAINLASLLLNDAADSEVDTLIAGLIEHDPRSRAALTLLSRRHLVLRRWAEADEALQRALQLGPADAELHHLRARALTGMGELDGAIAACRQALALDPDFVAAYNSLGVALQSRGDLGAAVDALRQADRRDPDNPDTLTNLGMILVAQSKADDGIALLQKAVALEPGHVGAAYCLGQALAQVGRLTEAAAACRAVIERQSDHVDAHINLGIALCHQGHIAESVVALRRAHALAPERADCFSNLLFISNYHAELAPNTLAELHRGFGRKYETVAVAGHANDRSPGRRLRIGYVSPDFRQHSVANFLEALLQGHNTDAIEVSCYAAVKSPDAVTARLQAQAARWRNVMGLTDAAVADMIRTDGIDILIDLAGHTAGNRLGVFARKPAPVQATYLGYPNTTGLARIDYRITDAEADPPGADDRLYSERLYRLSRCFLAYRPVAEVPVVTARPSAAAKSITFGSFNMLAKMSPQTIAAWAAVLRARPEARLVIKSAPLVDRATGERTHAWFAEHGIATNRVQLVPFMQNRGRHFAAYGQIDIALDTFPYNGTTTTCEALWMGVPVVTSAGDRHAARVGKSLLHAIGLDELVAPSVEGYVTLACELAADRARVAALSLGLRERVAASPLCDARGLAQTLEAAYRDMWQRWCVQA